MSAYIIADVQVTDAQQYDEYRIWSSRAIETHGVKVLVRGGATECLEGRPPGRIVILEFTDRAAARSFYDSSEYLRARQARQGAAVMNMLIVEGI